MDILGFELNAKQIAGLTQLHRMCAVRMSVKLPANLNSPRCPEYEQVQRIDATIAEHAPKLGMQRVEIRKQRNEETGIIEEVKEYTSIRDEEAARIVWQYYFIANPHRFH